MQRYGEGQLPKPVSCGMLGAMDSAAARVYLSKLAEDSRSKAFVLSLVFHCVLFAAVEAGHRAGWWQQSLLSALQLARKEQLNRAAEKQAHARQDVPLVFVEVDPAQAASEPPKDTKYYSSHNSRAANPDAQTESDVPKISGTQDQVPRTSEQARPNPNPVPLQPAPSIAESKPDPKPLEPEPPEPKLPETKPQPEPPESAALKPGDLAMARPAEKPDASLTPKTVEQLDPVTPPPPPRRRPLRIAEALQERGLTAGEPMKQEGGVNRYSIAEGLDVKATPFGSYDAAIIAAIQQRWYDLLEDRDFARNQTGKVVLTFKLMSDGSVTEMRVTENTVTEILALICQRAVQDPAPFARWPSDLRRLIGTDYREVRFTFHYN